MNPSGFIGISGRDYSNPSMRQFYGDPWKTKDSMQNAKNLSRLNTTGFLLMKVSALISLLNGV